MRAGALQRRGTIQQATETRDGYGAAVKTWSDLDKVWMNIEPLQGRELFTAQQVQPEVTHKVTMRYRTGITSKMRIVDQGDHTLYIISVIDIGDRQRGLELLCKEQA